MSGAGGTEVGRISVKVVPDTDDFRQKLKKKLEEIEKSLKGEITLDAHLDTLKARGDMASLMGRLKAEARKGIDIKARVDQSQLSQLKKFGANSFAKGLTDAGDAAGYAGNQFLGLSRMGWIVTGVFAAAAPAIGLVAGLLAGLPSLVAAGGAGLAAIALGMDGIKKAAEDSGLFGDKNGDKKGGGGLGAAFTSLKEAVSGTFREQLTGPFTQLAGILPQLAPGMQAVAAGISQMASGLINAISSGPGLALIQNILTQTGELFTGLAPIIQAATGQFLTLANSGANAFGLLLAPLQKYSDQFQGIVDRITSNGSFESALSGLSEVLGSVLNLFGRLFESGVTAMGQLGGPLSTLIDGFGNALIAMMPALTTLSGLIGNVLGTALNQLAPVITALTPGFTQLANLLGTTLVTALTALGPSLQIIGSSLSGAMTSAIQQIAPLLPGMIDSFTKLAVVMAGQLANTLPVLASAFGTLIGVLAANGDTLIKSLADAFIQLAPQLPGVAQAFVQIAPAAVQFMQALGPVLPVVGLLVAQITTLLPLLVGLLGPLSSLGSSFEKTREGVANFVTAIMEAGVKAVAEVMSWPGKIVAALGDLGGQLYSAAVSAAGRFAQGFKDMIGNVVGAAGDLMGSVLNVIPHSPAKEGPLSGSGWDAIKQGGVAVGQQFADGLASTQSTLVDTASGLMQSLQDTFGGADMASVAANAKSLSDSLDGVVSSAAQPLIDAGVTSEDLTRADKLLTIQQKQLEAAAKRADAEAKAAGDDKVAKEAAEARARDIRAQKDQLGLQKDQLGLAQDYVSEIEKGTKSTKSGIQSWGDLLDRSLEGVKGFGGAVGGQFLNDLGIGGNGAISQGLKEGAGLMEQFIFNVLSVDDAMRVKDNETNKRAIQWAPSR